MFDCAASISTHNINDLANSHCIASQSSRLNPHIYLTYKTNILVRNSALPNIYRCEQFKVDKTLQDLDSIFSGNVCTHQSFNSLPLAQHFYISILFCILIMSDSAWHCTTFVCFTSCIQITCRANGSCERPTLICNFSYGIYLDLSINVVYIVIARIIMRLFESAE